MPRDEWNRQAQNGEGQGSRDGLRLAEPREGGPKPHEGEPGPRVESNPPEHPTADPVVRRNAASPAAPLPANVPPDDDAVPCRAHPLCVPYPSCRHHSSCDPYNTRHLYNKLTRENPRAEISICNDSSKDKEIKEKPRRGSSVDDGWGGRGRDVLVHKTSLAGRR